MSENLSEIYKKIEEIENKVDNSFSQLNRELTKIVSYLKKNLKVEAHLLKTGDKAKINQDLTLKVPIYEEMRTDSSGKEFSTFRVDFDSKEKPTGEFTIDIPEGMKVSVNKPGEKVTSVIDIPNEEIYSPELASNVTVTDLLIPNQFLEVEEK